MTVQETVGRVLTSAKIENLKDLWEARQGWRASDQVRRLELTDILVSAKVTSLGLPTRLIRELGLTPLRMANVLGTDGPGRAMTFEPVRLTIQDRECTVEVLEVPDEVPTFVGQIPLGILDLVVDPRGYCLIGNPAHGGEHVLELS